VHADALASLAASLALPARAKERALIYSHDLYYYKFALEASKTPRGDLQVKKVLETSTSLKPRDWKFPYIDFVLYGILPDDPKEELPLEGKLLGFITMRSREHYIIGRMMKSYSNTFHTTRHMRRSKKLMTVYVELTNLELSSETGFEDLAVTGRG